MRTGEVGSKARTRWPWAGLLLLVVLAVTLRVVTVSQFEAHHPLAEHLVIDERSYDAWGAEIAGGDWLGDEVFFQEPLYPYFLGVVYTLFGHDLFVLRVVQSLLGGLTTLLVFLLARRLFGTLAGWCAGLGFALFPAAVLLPCLVLKPNLFLPLLAGLALLLTRPERGPKTWLAAGLLGGLGALLRGNLLILLPLLALWPWLRRRESSGGDLRQNLRAGGLFLGGVALVLVPVLLRNGHVGGVYALTTSGAGTNFYGGNNPDNPHGVATEFDWVRGIPRYEADDWRREAERRTGRALDAGESSSYWMGEAFASMGRDPGLHLSILWNKLRLALGDYEVPDNHHLEWDARYVPLLGPGWPGFGLWGGCGLAGLLLLLARRDLGRGRGELALLFVLYLGTIVATVMSMRARLPLLVLLLPFTGYWAREFSEAFDVRGRAAQLRSMAAALLALVLGAGVACLPVFSAEQREEDLADRDYNLVVTWLERGEELDGASHLAEELAQRYPRSSRLQTLLADTEWRRGRALAAAGNVAGGEELVDAALARLRRVTEAEGISPRERSRAWRLAGYVQAQLGRWDAAERFFHQAREFAGEDLELRVSHGQALLMSARALPEGVERREREARGRVLLEGVMEEAPDSAEADGARWVLEGAPEPGT